MIVEADGNKLMDVFQTSVLTLIDDISKQVKWIKENDPDPIRTTNYMVDKKLREWFNSGGHMGY